MVVYGSFGILYFHTVIHMRQNELFCYSSITSTTLMICLIGKWLVFMVNNYFPDKHRSSLGIQIDSSCRFAHTSYLNLLVWVNNLKFTTPYFSFFLLWPLWSITVERFKLFNSAIYIVNIYQNESCCDKRCRRYFHSSSVLLYLIVMRSIHICRVLFYKVRT